MRVRKIRGHKRRWKQIQSWKNSNLNLDLDYIKEYERDYTKIRIHPWSGLSLKNSTYPEPKRQTKLKMLNGLFDIYDQWKNQLDKLGKPYYLKIWLYDNRFSMSQIVCATGEYVDFYAKTFNKSEKEEQIKSNKYKAQLQPRIEIFNWECHLDEDHFDNTDLGQPDDYETIEEYLESKIWFEKLMKKPHKTVKFKEPIGDAIESYSFEKGKIWIGEKK
jgi:hypothetical protein